MNALVSVIMPVYNSADTILKSIQSVLCQSYRNLELIVVNDGSTDDTECRINTVGDSRLRYIKKENGGVVSAYKQGIQKSKGSYIMFCDSDDTFAVDFVERGLADISRYECDFCAYSYRLVDSKGNELRRTENSVRSGLYADETLKKDIYPHIVFNAFAGDKSFILATLRWNKIYRRKLLERILPQLDDKCFQIEDNVFMILTLLNAKSFYVDNTYLCYDYLAQENSISAGYRGVETIKEYFYTISRIQNILRQYKYTGSARQINWLAYHSAYIVFRRCCKSSDYSSAKELIKIIIGNEFVKDVGLCELQSAKNRLYHILLKLHLYYPAYIIFGL